MKNYNDIVFQRENSLSSQKKLETIKIVLRHAAINKKKTFFNPQKYG